MYSWPEAALENISDIIFLIIPIVIINTILIIVAIIDLVKREESAIAGGNKWLWGALIVFIQFFGPLAYLLFGRKNN